MKRRISGAVLFVAVLLLSLSTAVSQGMNRSETNEGKELYDGLRTTILDWARESVLPHLQEWKAQLDEAMTPQDLAELNELRAEATALRKEAREMMTAMKDAWNGEDYGEMGAKREAMNGLRERRNDMTERLRPIAERYTPALKEIGAEAKEESRGWKKEVRTIFFDWIEENRDALVDAEGDSPNMNKRRGLMKMLDKIDPDLSRKVIVARFMLWDGGDFVKDLQETGAEGDILDGMDFQ